ncbi:alpha/beta hydrolase [Streptomyces sp. PG2]
MRIRISRRIALAAGALALLGAATAPGVATASAERPAAAPKPTVVLVHGAWADSSSWSPVMERLRKDGYKVRALADPLQGLTGDTAYVSSYLATIDGPVVLVGHSYGGAVITNAAASDPDVKALVYIAGFIPVKGETVGDLAAKSTPPVPLVYTQVPDGTDVSIDPAKFRETFAGDLDRTTAEDLAATQRPRQQQGRHRARHRRGVPHHSVLQPGHHPGPRDQPGPPALHVQRAGAHIDEVAASHAVMLSRPGRSPT